jgi:hypothetical protein
MGFIVVDESTYISRQAIVIGRMCGCAIRLDATAQWPISVPPSRDSILFCGSDAR